MQKKTFYSLKVKTKYLNLNRRSTSPISCGGFNKFWYEITYFGGII